MTPTPITVKDLLKRSLRMIGHLAPGQNPSDSVIVDALLALNSMLDAWNADRLNVYAIATESYQLTSSQRTYTCGLGGDFDRPERPQRIETAILIQGDARSEIEVITEDSTFARRSGYQSSGAPQRVYVDGAYPLANLEFDPTPAANDTVELHVWTTLYGYEDETGLVELPPGYADAIAYNLAVRLAPEWRGTLRPETVELARQGLALIQAANAPQPIVECDSAVLRVGSPARFDILTGRF